FWPTPINTGEATFSYVSNAALGTGADASALVLANPTTTSPSFLGGFGYQLGMQNLSGVAVVIAEYPEAGLPSETNPGNSNSGWVAITNGWNAQTQQFNWLATAELPKVFGGVQDNPLNVSVSVDNGTISVAVDNVNQITLATTVPSSALVGFVGSTGALDNYHEISNLRVTVGTNT
ncbi:MAG: L-type lectin family protein, partial [Acidimicrobiales bacterium]